MHSGPASDQNARMLEELESPQRLQLLQFVCSFAWADLEVRDEEREFIKRIVDRLELGAEEEALVNGWLESPPAPDSVDPMNVPAEHRKLFIETIEGLIAADGEIAIEERESLDILRELFA